MEKNLYINSARFYDIGNELKKYDCDIDFYRSYVKMGTRVLELGCGTGRVTLPLLKDCSSITAVDLSEQMLTLLQTKVSELDESLRKKLQLRKEDMCSFEWQEKFDLIIFPGVAFSAITAPEGRSACLNCVKRHLAEGGHVIIDMMNPDEGRVSRTGSERKDFEYFDMELNATVRKLSVIESHDPRKQTQNIKYTFEIIREGESLNQIEDYFELAYLYPYQAQKLFLDNGFKVHKSYGWYDFSEIDEENKSMQIYDLVLDGEKGESK